MAFMHCVHEIDDIGKNLTGKILSLGGSFALLKWYIFLHKNKLIMKKINSSFEINKSIIPLLVVAIFTIINYEGNR